jgi:hypothetical protein
MLNVGALLAAVNLASQSAVQPLAFEVASIRVTPKPWHVLHNYTASGPRLTLEGYNAVGLIIFLVTVTTIPYCCLASCSYSIALLKASLRTFPPDSPAQQTLVSKPRPSLLAHQSASSLSLLKTGVVVSFAFIDSILLQPGPKQGGPPNCLR